MLLGNFMVDEEHWLLSMQEDILRLHISVARLYLVCVEKGVRDFEEEVVHSVLRLQHSKVRVIAFEETSEH